MNWGPYIRRMDKYDLEQHRRRRVIKLRRGIRELDDIVRHRRGKGYKGECSVSMEWVEKELVAMRKELAEDA